MNNFIKRPNEHIFIPLEAIHRIQNPGNKPVKIMEAQVGSILKETDIVRLQDVYGRVKQIYLWVKIFIGKSFVTSNLSFLVTSSICSDFFFKHHSSYNLQNV